jgi:rod shape-determining protein MreC
MGGILPPAERRSSALVALYVATSLLLLAAGERLPQATLRGVGAAVFAPLDRVIMAADRVTGSWRENRELHQRVAALELENTRLRGLDGENRSLRQQLARPGYQGLTLIPPRSWPSGEPNAASATLSAGASHGVRTGDAVVTSDGLVGRIGEVYRSQSRVVLLTDQNAAVACEVESTGVLGVLRFSAAPHPRLVLTLVPFADTVLVGQRILTSGLSRRYPRGIPVGRVVRLGTAEGGLTQEIEVASAARLTRLRNVFVIPGPADARGTP